MAAESVFTMPAGMIPVMLTPFAADGSVDLTAVAALTNWYLAAGAVALFPVAQVSGASRSPQDPEQRL
jgi:dihydrodipicolinate synthase/N-acetylneuraminate lyase